MTTVIARKSNRRKHNRPRPRRTQDELQKASGHVRYEIWMLTSTANILAKGPLGEEPLKNAVLESFIMHTRTVLDFLYNDHPQDTDITATDFVPAALWLRERPAESEVLRTARERANKEVAHLTYNRLDVPAQTKEWRFVEISHQVEQAFKVFVELAKWNFSLGESITIPIMSATSSTYSEICEVFQFPNANVHCKELRANHPKAKRT